MTLAEFILKYPKTTQQTPSKRKSVVGCVYVSLYYSYSRESTVDIYHLSDYVVSSSVSAGGFYLVPRL